MSTQNGSQTPTKPPINDETMSGTKRKRSNTAEEPAILLRNTPNEKQFSAPASIAGTLDDILAILYQSEVGPSILNTPVPSDADSQPTKKTKLSDGPLVSKSISERVAESTYSRLEELEADVSAICDTQIADIKRPEEGSSTKLKRLSQDDVAQIQDYMSLKETVRELVAQESSRQKGSSTAKINGVKVEPTSKSTHLVPHAGRTVLSLYGNAQGAKQLFSSLQDEVATDLSLEELGLPTMLTATKVLPLTHDDTKKKSKTFSDVFPPPSSLPELQPPPKSIKSSAKNPVIGFISSEKPISRSAAKKMSYPYQPLNVSHWIRYGDSSSRRRERPSEKQRERSGSVVEREMPQDANVRPQREEDLFPAAYSSFAPSYDSTRAAISADSRNLVWWQRCGRRKFDSIFAMDQSEQLMEESLLDEDDDPVKLSAAHEKQMWEKAIDEYDDSSVDLPEPDLERSPSELEAQELLSEINDLLRTLASHQRIRNTTIPSHGRTPSISSPSPMRAVLSGTPAEPTPEEIETYRAIKERLAEVIAKLPPYAVAKLDGQQIEDLRVSTTILLENRSIRGVLEEDQITRLTKATQAAATAASTARASTSGGYGQLARSSSITGGRHALTPQSYQGGRSSISHGRPPTNLAAATPSGHNNRHSFSQLTSQTAPVNRTSQPPSYSQPGQQNYQRQNYLQQFSQGSPQPPAQRWPNQYGTTQATYQNSTQFRNAISYGQNTFSAQPQQGQSPAQQSYRQQQPGYNGRSTPVSSIAPAPQRIASPMKPYQPTDGTPRPSSATPQPGPAPTAQTNGVQTNGL